MRERPIPFTAPNVGLILRDEQTQTRRVAKLTATGRVARAGHNWHPGDPDAVQACPYGVVEDRLWVRESWRIGAWNEDTGELWLDYRTGGVCRRDSVTIPDDEDGEKFTALWQDCCEELSDKGVAPDSTGKYHWPKGQSPLRWRTPRFMPRWASRLLLEVVQVRVQRLQDITEEDAIAEGIYQVWSSAWSWLGDPDYAVFSSPTLAYRGEWDAINAKRAPWESNPLVWALTFRRVK